MENKKKIFVQLIDAAPQEHTALTNFLQQVSSDGEYEFFVSKTKLESIPPQQVLSLVEKILGDRNKLKDIINEQIELNTSRLIAEATPGIVMQTIKNLKAQGLVR